MALTLRTTGLPPCVYPQQKDYTVFQDSRPIGRLYEDPAAGARHELRWCWAITVVVDARAGVRTEGWTASFEEAKAHFQENWERWKAWAKIAGQPTVRSS
jgi:hypothetical protein